MLRWHILFLTVIGTLGVALVMIHSAAMGVGQPFNLLSMASSRQAIYAAVAVAAMWLASRIDFRQFQRVHGWHNPLCWMCILSLLLVGAAMVPGLGRSVHGARRWLYLGPSSWGLSFQPSEVVKWVTVLFVAWWCARRQGAMARFWHGLLPPLMLVGLAGGLVVIEDLGTGVLIAVVALLMLLAGGARLWQLCLLVPPATAVVVGAILYSPYRFARVMAFLDPWRDPEGIGYHPIQSMLAISGGGLTGRGLGNSIQKFGYLPEDTTDFLFAVVCEELGIAGAILVVAAILVLLWTGLGVLRDAEGTFARLICLGVILTVGLQAVFNIAVVTVVVPTKGIALPLVSAGGTGWILTAAAVGLVAAIDRAHQMRVGSVETQS